MSRKTIKVETVRDECNRLLASEYGTPDYRLGISVALEWLLMLSGNYNGFKYLTKDEVPENEKPGIVWEEDQQGRPAPNFTVADETRRRYF